MALHPNTVEVVTTSPKVFEQSSPRVRMNLSLRTPFSVPELSTKEVPC